MRQKEESNLQKILLYLRLYHGKIQLATEKNTNFSYAVILNNETLII